MREWCLLDPIFLLTQVPSGAVCSVKIKLGRCNWIVNCGPVVRNGACFLSQLVGLVLDREVWCTGGLRARDILSNWAFFFFF